MDRPKDREGIREISLMGLPAVMHGESQYVAQITKLATRGLGRAFMTVDMAEVTEEALQLLFHDTKQNPVTALFMQPHLAPPDISASVMRLIIETPMQNSFMAIVVDPEHRQDAGIPNALSAKMPHYVIDEQGVRLTNALSHTPHPGDSPQVAGYFIRVPEEHIDDLGRFLQERGIVFDPVNSMTACHQELFLDRIWTGHYGQELIDDINGHHEAPSRLHIRTPFTDMTPAQQWTILLYATLHCEWKVDYDERELKSAGAQELENIKAEYPQLFA